MRIRGAAPLAAILLTLPLTACGGSGRPAAAPAAPATGQVSPVPAAAGSPSAGSGSTGPSAPPSAPAPTPTVPSVGVLTQQVSHIKITVHGARVAAQDRSGLPPLDVCGGSIAAYQQVKAVTVWQWLGPDVPTLKEGIFGFQAVTGADVVAQARALATSCTAHNLTIGIETIKVTVNGPPRLATPAGVDGFYAFCETQTITKPAIGAGIPLGFCTAVMGRGNIAVFLTAGGSTLAAARAAVTKYLSLTAKALVAAVS